MTIVDAATPTDYWQGRALIEEYAENLGVDLCFQNFSDELTHLTEMYGPPQGFLLLARADAAAIGCVAVRPLEHSLCEMKRLYVGPTHRGQGAGRALAVAAIARATALGYRRMVLDTLPVMTEARALYASLGFRECASYAPNPQPGVQYLAVDLAPNTST